MHVRALIKAEQQAAHKTCTNPFIPHHTPCTQAEKPALLDQRVLEAKQARAAAEAELRMLFYLDALDPGVEEVLATYDFHAALARAASQVWACAACAVWVWVGGGWWVWWCAQVNGRRACCRRGALAHSAIG